MKGSTSKKPRKAAPRRPALRKSTRKKAARKKVVRKKVARRRIRRPAVSSRKLVRKKMRGCRIVNLRTGKERPVTPLSIRLRECIRWNSQGGAFRLEFLIWPFCEASDRVITTPLGPRFVVDVDPGRSSNKFTIHIPRETNYRIVALGQGVSADKPPTTGPAVVGGD